jgi:hypothetical protein
LARTSDSEPFQVDSEPVLPVRRFCWMQEPAPPGSREAIAKGCKCSAKDNNYGKGTQQGDEFFFFPELECPLHGIDALMKDAGVKDR